MEKILTAVEWLRSKMLIECLEPSDELFEQAKEMEKHQIIKAAAQCHEDMFGSDGTEYGEEYYNNLKKEL
jgi:hypothetical protein